LTKSSNNEPPTTFDGILWNKLSNLKNNGKLLKEYKNVIFADKSILDCKYPKHTDLNKLDDSLKVDDINNLVIQVKQLINYLLNLKQLVQLNERPQGNCLC
jgi:hypothetical protein